MKHGFYTKLLNGKQGFTVVELLIVMLAGLILVGSAGKLADMMFTGTKTTKILQGLARLRSNVQQLYAVESSYTGTGTASVDITEKIVKAKAIPSEFTESGNKVTHPLSGNVTIVADTADKFYISIDNIPKEQCHKILSSSLNGVWSSVALKTKTGTVTSAISAPCTDPTTMFFYSE